MRAFPGSRVARRAREGAGFAGSLFARRGCMRAREGKLPAGSRQPCWKTRSFARLGGAALAKARGPTGPCRVYSLAVAYCRPTVVTWDLQRNQALARGVVTPSDMRSHTSDIKGHTLGHSRYPRIRPRIRPRKRGAGGGGGTPRGRGAARGARKEAGGLGYGGTLRAARAGLVGPPTRLQKKNLSRSRKFA